MHRIRKSRWKVYPAYSKKRISPAEKKGSNVISHFCAVILAVDDIAVDRVGEVLRVIKGTEVGNEVTLTIFRSGETFVVPVKLGKKPSAQDEHEG